MLSQIYYNECPASLKVCWKSTFHHVESNSSNQFLSYPHPVILLKAVPCPLPSCFTASASAVCPAHEPGWQHLDLADLLLSLCPAFPSKWLSAGAACVLKLSCPSVSLSGSQNLWSPDPHGSLCSLLVLTTCPARTAAPQSSYR